MNHSFPKTALLSVLLVAVAPTALADTFHLRVPSLGLRAAPLVVSPELADFAIPTQSFGAADFALQPPRSTSPGAFVYESSDPSVARVSGDIVTVVGVGTTVITAYQAASGKYEESSIEASLLVVAAAPQLGQLGSLVKYMNDPEFDITPPTSPSTGAFAFTSSDPTVASVTGRRVKLLKPGTVTITAQQAAMGGYLGATATASLEVRPAPSPTRVGDGVSKIGACTSGVTGCATFNTKDGWRVPGTQFSQSNLRAVMVNPAAEVQFTAKPTSGKYYFELSTTNGPYNGSNALYFGGNYINMPAGEYQVRADYDTKSARVYREGTYIGTISMTSSLGFIQLYGNITMNFGQSNFQYPVPAGFKAGLW